MPRKQEDRPLHKIMMTRSQLQMAVEHPDAFDDAALRSLVADANEVMQILLVFRNIISSMAAFDEHPSDAARPYVEK